ncbi:hypothetical protein DC428_02990 [Priestia megaterium]|nr:hypothetical protein DC428_02990 [Priestia megaterium]PVE88273.1 hypothetical protein DC426_14220 [Priestia megaterium]
MNPDKKLLRLPMLGELFIFGAILGKEYLMLLKTLVTAIIGGILFPLSTKLFMQKKTTNKDISYITMSLSFAIIFFITLLFTKTFT